MKRYESYKDSGIEWIGEIPEHWIIKRIKHTTYVKGRIGWQGLRSEEFLEVGESYVVTGTDFKDGKINWNSCYQITKERYDEDPYIQLKEDDLLITKDGTIGKIALVKDIPTIATLNSGVFVTRPKTEDYITGFMYWILVSDVFDSFFNNNKSGSTILHLYQNVFNEFRFICPTLVEQTQIAKYLDQKTTKIDKLIADKQNLIALLNEERTAMINQAVTKGLNPNVPMKDSGVEWLGEIPAHWEVKKLRYLINIKSGKGFSNDDIDPNGIYPVYGGNGILGYTNDFTSSDVDLIVGRVGAYCGNVYLVTGSKWISDNALQIQTTQDYLFLYYLLKFLDLNRLANKSAQPLITGTMIKSETIAMPNMSEQKSIVKQIEREELRIKNLLGTINQEIELLKEYKTALISEVVTGKIDVRDEVIANCHAEPVEAHSLAN
ncbi:restriction endonuclease subunit S [Pedobacter mucosus]|uniref:restriction endonuclease subunit S n=1 Tax=Pedobacter mucosus TaxID=2895286 RepID=UPI001EE3F955|nr:restriction endonuclease subunit S [Pedobacter mucosus]UKT65822.1 restriction endonuclease subunit S [Pedobacter mucosus]